jgi:2-amino-4-hydroxy-6-hydroxymethyldihydropteridine diphosphokinase
MDFFKNLEKYENSEKQYKLILETFNFDQSKDIEARDILFELRHNTSPKFSPKSLIDSVKQEIKSKTLQFFGTGPSLDHYVKNTHQKITHSRDNTYIIAADGAANCLINYKILPDIIFTDLDGLTPDQFVSFVEQRVIIVIHAHGDNIEKIKSFSKQISRYEKIIGTTQVEPRFPILNPGGFTDGDRSVYFFHHISEITIPFRLIGYDFGNTVGKYSKPHFSTDMVASPIKKQKLNLCKQFLTSLTSDYHRIFQYYTLSDV